VRKIGAERQQLTELNQQLHVLEQTLKGWCKSSPKKAKEQPCGWKLNKVWVIHRCK
jgi:hypothetical protein